MELFFLVVGAVEEILDIGYWWKIWLKVTAEKLVEQIFSSSSIFLENWHDFFEHQSFADFLGFEEMVEDLLVFHGEELFEWHWLLAFVEGKNAFLLHCQIYSIVEIDPVVKMTQFLLILGLHIGKNEPAIVGILNMHDHLLDYIVEDLLWI